jgi:chromosome segregation ATPase
MITLEQVRLLDQKVNQAVELISSLKSENQMLKDKLESYQKKISELEVLLSGLKEDQSEVEVGFRKALDTLSALEKTGEREENASQVEKNFETESDSDEEAPGQDEESDREEEESLEAETESESEDAELDIF